MATTKTKRDTKKANNVDMLKVMENPRYRGKHIIVVAGKVFTARTGDGATRILEMVHKKYPKETPQITYIPKADTLILVTCP